MTEQLEKVETTEVLEDMGQQHQDDKVMLELIHKNLEKETALLHEVDENITNVAKTVIGFSKTTMDTNEKIIRQTQLLDDFIANSQQMTQQVDKLKEMSESDRQQQQEMVEMISDFSGKTDELVQSVNKSSDDLTTGLKEHQAQFDKIFNETIEHLDTTASQLASLDITSPINSLSAKIASTHDLLKNTIVEQTAIDEGHHQYMRSLNEQLQKMVTDLHETYERLSKRQDISSVLAKLDAIELQLNVLNTPNTMEG